jgi:thymidylate synthase
MQFQPLYHADRITIINPTGDVGVITLWSPVEQALRKFEDIDPTLMDSARSRIAVVSNLYGDGMFAMFCNILYNPQIRHLVAVGQDLGLPICAEIEAFLKDGLEPGSVLGRPMKQIKGTNRYFPEIAEFDEAALQTRLSFRAFGKFSAPGFRDDLTCYLAELPIAADTCSPRIRVPIPEPQPTDYSYLPSDPLLHQVSRRHPLHCWEELVVRTMRFGRPVSLKKGLRIELQNVKAVIEEPIEEPARALEKYGFRLAQFEAYQARMLQAALPESISYTYGNRLRGFFDQDAHSQDTLETVIQRLRADPETRHAYISLWDTSHDLTSPFADDDSAVPCLTTLFFRRTEGKLALTATYRAHNLLTAWLENVYGLIAIQRHVSEAAGIPAGPLTVISHSLGIDPTSTRFVYADAIRNNWKTDDDVDEAKIVLRTDPHGYFILTADAQSGEIVAEHRYGSVLIKSYRGTRAEEIERQISKDMAVSLVSHAMWLGRELVRAEQRLQSKAEKAQEITSLQSPKERVS